MNPFIILKGNLSRDCFLCFRSIWAVVFLLLVSLAFASPAHAQSTEIVNSLPNPSALANSITDPDEDTQTAKRLAALDAMGDILQNTRQGGRYVGRPSPAANEKGALYSAVRKEIFDAHREKLKDNLDAWKAFYHLSLRYERDAQYKLSVIEQHVPSQLAFMKNVYAQDEAYLKNKSKQFNDARFAEYFDAHGNTIVLAIIFVLGSLLIFIATRTTGVKKYSGTVSLVGEGVSENKYGITRRSVVEIGDHVLKNIHTTMIISSYLKAGEEMDLYIAPLWHARFVYAIKREGRPIVKMGMGQLFTSLLAKCLAVGPFWLIKLNEDDREYGLGSIIFGVLALYLFFRSFKAFYNYYSIK